MVKTTDLITHSADMEHTSRTRLGCDGSGGGYFLPKSMVAVSLKVDAKSEVEVEHVRTVARPDEGQAYCLDYKGSPTSDDFFEVKRTESGLLTAITTTADDKTGDILDTIIDTVFEGIKASSGLTRTRRAGFQQQFKSEFDPFDQWDTALNNDALREFGLCVMIEGAMPFDKTKYRDQKAHNEEISKYCDNPLRYIAQATRDTYPKKDWRREFGILKSQEKFVDRHRLSGLENRTALAVLHKPYRWGVLYRPRLSYPFVIFVKARFDLESGAANPWKLKYRKIVQMENAAPILAVGVDRTFFAKRDTTLRFDLGMLVDIDVQKSSELEEFVKLPLKVVEKAVELPTDIVQLRLENNNNRAALIRAQNELIQLQVNRNAAQANLAQSATLGAPTGAPPTTLARRSQQSFTAAGPFEFSNEFDCRRQCQSDGTSIQACEVWCSCVSHQCLSGAVEPDQCFAPNICPRP